MTMTRVGQITCTALVLAFAAPRGSWAAASKKASPGQGAKEGGEAREAKGVVAKIDALNASAAAAYKAGDSARAKAELMDALVLGKKNDLDTNPVLGRTYLELGVVQLEGFKDREKAQRYLSLALRINKDISAPPDLATPGVTRELDELRGQGSTPPGAAAPAAPAAAPATSAPDGHEREALRKELAQEREAKEKLQKEKLDVDKQLAAAKEAEKKEREAREKLAKEKLEVDKQLTAMKDSEKKERETREKLQKELTESKDSQQKEKLAAEARDKERKAQEDKDRAARQKLADGPDLPSSIPQPLYCPTPDEGQQGSEVYIHCVTQPGVKGKPAALFYRPSGMLHFNSLAMEKTRKGWYAAVIPASFASGKVLQFYVEAHNDRGDVIANYGRATSPNIMTLKPPGTPVASSARRDSGGGLVKASAKTRSARKPPPAKK
jgi:hypothetical protein